MKFNLLLSAIICSLLLGCGDEVESVPDLSIKAAAVEPDSFSFETATAIEDLSGSYSPSISSNIPVGETRYYALVVDFFSADFVDVSLVSSSGTVLLSWYDEDKNLKNSDANTLDLTPVENLIEDGCYDCDMTFYVAIENTDLNEVEFDVTFSR